MENLIRSLGQTYQELTYKKLIDGPFPRKLYESDESLEINLTSDIELVFCEDDLAFEMIVIDMESYSNNPLASANKLPTPLDSIHDKNDVRAKLGEPISSKTSLELHGTDFYGWDSYQLENKLHPEAILDIQYNSQMKIRNLIISLMNKRV